MPTAVRSGVQRGNGRGPELPPLVGRDDALDHYRRTRETAAKVLLCFYGVIKIGKTALLEAIEQEARDNGDYPVLVDLDRHATRVEAGEVVRAKLTRRRRWRLMTRFAVIQEHLAEHRTYAERGAVTGLHPLDPSGGIRGLPGKALHGVWRLGRRVLRREQVRWVEKQLEQLPPGGTRAADRARVERLEQLVPVALALDIDELARRSGDRRIVLLFDHHERSRAAVAASQRQDDLVLALAQLLHERDASVTVVVARDSPLDPGTGYWTRNGEADSHGAIRSDRLQHRRLEQVSREHARECLERMGLEEPLIGRLVDLCMGHPGVLVGCARYGVVPTVMRDLDDDAGIREVLTDVLRQMLDRLDDADRRLLRLAATVRAFDRSLLDKLAGGPAVEWEWYQDKKRAGLIEPVRDAEGAESAWRVEPVWRALLFRDLASGRDRQLFRHGHTVALGHLEGLTAPAGDDQRFALELERAYHSAALSPEDGLDELVRMADRQLADHRDDRWAKILEAAKQLYSLEGRDEAKAVLLEAKFLSDVRRYDDARRLLEEASKRFPVDGSFGFPGVSIALELAKLNRLRGFYSTAASRYRELEAGALQSGNDAVAAHCAWGLSLVYKQLGDFPKGRTKLVEAKDGVDVVLRDDPAGAERAARRFGIRKLAVKPAHLLRHEAELDRLQGLYASAHDRLDDALALYADGEPRATAYGNAVRAHLLRLEGRLDEAVELAEQAGRESESGSGPEQRLRLYALRAEVLARVARQEAPREEAAELAETPLTLYPAARPSGLLALAEIDRNGRRWLEALSRYGEVLSTAERLGGRVEACAARLGMLECLRAAPELEDDTAPRDQMLDELLADPCLPHVPWLTVRAQLARACHRPRERDDALAEADRALGGFTRRLPADVRLDDALVASVRGQLEAGDDVMAIPLDHL